MPPAVAAPALNAAALVAATRQGGLALLMADLAQALRIPGLPAPVQAAATQILGFRAALDAPPTSADIKAALTRTDLSPQAQPAAAAVPAGATQAAASPVPSGGELKGALVGLQQVLKTWLDSAPAQPPSSAGPAAAIPAGATIQGGSAVPNTAPSPAVQGSGQPTAAESAVVQLPAPPPSNSVPSGADSNSVAARTDPSLETALAPTTTLPKAASPATPALPPIGADVMPIGQQAANTLPAGAPAAPTALPAATPAAPALSADETILAGSPNLATGIDLKAALPVPQQVMTTSTGAGPAEPAALSAVTAAATSAERMPPVLPASVDLGGVLQVFQQFFKAWFDGAPAKSPLAMAAGGAVPGPLPGPQPAAPAANSPPPPPYRGGPTSAEPSVPSTLPLNADPATVADRLMRDTDGALAHQELLKIASQPGTAPSSAHSDGKVSEWMFEIPFATPQGSAVAQFKINRDGGKGNKGEQTTVWRARFSLDVEPTGPVHAQIALSGERTWVSLWAERDEGVTRLRGHEPLLTKALKDSDFVAEIAIHAGAPRQPATATGKFLNSES
jgi:hypothetical protein